MTYRNETESLRREVESLKKELHSTQARARKSWAEPMLKLRNFSAVMIAINAVSSIIGIAYSAIFFEKDPLRAAFVILGAIFSILWCVTTLVGEISAAYRSREE
jgi:tryptophan-rich sensory protein